VKQHSTVSRVTRPDGTQSVARAFAILRVFSDARREWTLADLARTLELAKPTTLRLLGVLEREGMVQRGRPGGSYRLGPRAIELGALAQRSIDFQATARPELERLAWTTGETATLEMLAGTEIVVLDFVRGRRPGSWGEFVGARWPAHAAATGKVLLAASRHERTEAWPQFQAATRGRLARFTARTLTTMSRLGEELTQTLRRGYATAIEELEPGYVAIGAPIENHTGRTIAAICLGGQTARITRERRTVLIRAVVDAARRISVQLGASAAARLYPVDRARGG
jgi:DNA-binding IclR family transcriptional regulator